VTVFILDSDHLTFLQKDGSPEHRFLVERMRLHPLDKFFVTIVSFHEQVNGWNAYIHRAREANGVVRGYAMFESF
jgi:tRNA(fMet)-specific endonuclease VapC